MRDIKSPILLRLLLQLTDICSFHAVYSVHMVLLECYAFGCMFYRLFSRAYGSNLLVSHEIIVSLDKH